MKQKNYLIGIVIFLAVGCAHTFKNQILSFQEADSNGSYPVRTISSEGDFYTQEVQQIFNFRCIACHSCMESPCQLNLQSYDGLDRGIFKENVYGTNRLKSTSPNRMHEDSLTTEAWRAKGFHEVIGTSENSVLLKVLEMGQGNRVRVTKSAESSQVCMSQQNGADAVSKVPQLAMPYGMSPIAQADLEKVKSWLQSGAPAPERKNPLAFSEQIQDQVKDWTEFFNQSTLKGQLVSRYLFEHYFLAHFYFENSPREFLRLIRSSSTCDSPTPIATRTPNSDPKTKNLHYCFVKEQGTIVSKNHIPYKLNDKKLSWLKNLFFESEWTASSLPSYDPEIATNPFQAFKEIPVKARYQFLIEDSQYHVMTFIKGPVCHGSVAVNSIQEQFFVFFMKPESDLMVRSEAFAKTFEKTSNLPGQWGDLVPLQNTLPVYADLLKKRNEYRQKQNEVLKVLSPGGLSLDDIWDGDEENPNSVLTVFRHDDNAAVFQGAKGDLSKTVFMLDYSTFERLCYNLVVNFDVYGSLGHQFLTRLYMDLIRMDSENNYLNFLPQTAREKVKTTWYQGLLTKIKILKLNETQFPEMATQVKFKNPQDPHLEMIQKILFERLKPIVSKNTDSVNWKRLANPPNLNSEASEASEVSKASKEMEAQEIQLRRMASVKANLAPFSQFFPELSFLFVGNQKVYSLIHNREHMNVSWLTNESGRLAPQEDSMTIEEGIYGSYPNQFFEVSEENLDNFVDDALKIKNQNDYNQFAIKYAVDRMHPKIWNLYDRAYKEFIKDDLVQAGFLDLSRYRLSVTK